MWWLEAFNKHTGILVHEYSLRTLSTSRLQELLTIGDTVEMGGVRYPLEAGGFDVPPSMLGAFVELADEEFESSEDLDYQVSFFEE